MAEAVHYINPRLHQRSANIDDPDGPSPKQYEEIIRAFEKMNVDASIRGSKTGVAESPISRTITDKPTILEEKSDDPGNAVVESSLANDGSAPTELDDASSINEATKTQADGQLNGLDLFHVNEPPASHVHCVGENFDAKNSYVYRSCEYKNLCYDLDRKELVVYADPSAFVADEDVEFKSSTQLSEEATVLAGSQPKT